MNNKNKTKRDFLFTATYTIGAVGVAAAVWPLVDQMNPDSSVKALSTTEVDVSSLEPGKAITVLWRGKPIFIKRRTTKEIEEAKNVDLKDLKDPEKDSDRAKNPEWLVMLEFAPILVAYHLEIQEIIKVGFVLAMGRTMIAQEELEKVQLLKI